MQTEQVFSKIIDDLVEKGWSVCPNFISEQVVEAIREEQKDLLEAGEFREAGIGKGNDFQVRPEIRSDKVLWLNEEEISDHVKIYFEQINHLIGTINRELYMGLKAFECHFAVYPKGSFYKKHLDQFQAVAYRKISCILYMNKDWTSKDGGQLRIYHPENQDEYVDILPVAGTFVCFLSDKIYHEVLPTERQRFSITGWIRDKEMGVLI
jgi:SM-20-related protein